MLGEDISDAHGVEGEPGCSMGLAYISMCAVRRKKKPAHLKSEFGIDF